MNPHFLFNSLNTVASLVASDPEKAEDIIVRLSDLYRGILDSSRQLQHSLAQELALCESYLAVESARFGDRLRSTFEISADLDPEAVLVPALSLQPLVENALKHGIAPRSSGGNLRVFARPKAQVVEIGVADDGVGFASGLSRPGAGTGLKNCRERLKLHYGAGATLSILERESGGTEVVLEVPVC